MELFLKRPHQRVLLIKRKGLHIGRVTQLEPHIHFPGQTKFLRSTMQATPTVACVLHDVHAVVDINVHRILLMIYTSIMPGELLACKADMIDYNWLEIYGRGKKAKKRKDIPIVFPEFIAPVLQELSEKSTSKTGKIFGGDEDAFYTVYLKSCKNIFCQKAEKTSEALA